MIIGIGNDIIEIERIKKAAENERFIKRWFNEKEQALFLENNSRPQTIAANFAAKEAFVKAVGTGFTKDMPPEEIAVLRDKEGKPYIKLFGRANERAKCMGIKKIFVSVSHCQSYAAAVVLCEGAD